MAEKKKQLRDSLREVSGGISILLMILSLWCFWHTIFWVIPINIANYMVIGLISNLVAIILIKRLRLFSAIPAYVLIALLIVRLILALNTEIYMRYYGTLYHAVHTGNAKVVQRRIDDGFDVNETINGDPIICEVFQLYAYRYRYEPDPTKKNIREKRIVEILKVLIDNGANVDAIDKKRGWSSLFWALAHFNTEAVKLLVNKSADVTLTDEEGYTPLHYAQLPESVQILVDEGADVNARAKNGNTPLHMAPAVDTA
ncbi:MAG: ankyrin repeat domain-containing protein [Planctomycetota bacterium]